MLRDALLANGDALTLAVENGVEAMRMERGSEQDALYPVFLADTVNHCVEMVQGTMKQDEHCIIVDIPAHLSVMAEEVRLRQLLLNLLHEAFSASPMGTMMVIGCHSYEEEPVIVRISCSPPEASLRKLSPRPIFQSEGEAISGVTGPGLAFFLSQALAKSMNGHVWFERSESGDIFAFSLKHAIHLSTRGVGMPSGFASFK